MEVLLFNFDKRNNSTKVVDDSTGTLMYCEMKDDVSVHDPTIFIRTSGLLEFNYAKLFGHYYFITNIHVENANSQTIYMTIDLLASYKDAILSQDFFVTYSSSDYSELLVDERVAIEAESVVEEIDYTDCRIFDGIEGSYMLQTISDKGMKYYCLDDPSKIDEIYRDITLLQDWPAFGMFSSAADGLISYTYLPIPKRYLHLGESTVVSVGNWTGTTTANVIEDGRINEVANLYLNNYYNDFRKFEPYSELFMELPFVGIVPLDISDFDDTGNVHIRMVGNVFSGIVEYMISDRSVDKKICKYEGHFGYPIPTGMTIPTNQPQYALSLLDTAGDIAKGDPVGALSAAARAFSYAGKRKSLIAGTSGGNYTEMINAQYRLILKRYRTRIEPSNLTELCGRPCSKVRKLEGLTGYCQTADAHVSLNTTSRIKQEINDIMNGGFYIE